MLFISWAYLLVTYDYVASKIQKDYTILVFVFYGIINIIILIESELLNMTMLRIVSVRNP